MKYFILMLAFIFQYSFADQTQSSQHSTGESSSASSSLPYVRDPRNWPTPVMDRDEPQLSKMNKKHKILVFSKTNGYRDPEQVVAANLALTSLIQLKKYDVFVTENAAIFNQKQLAKFDAVILNSISGDVFLPEQREVFKTWIENGGGVVALHGSGGDHHYDWPWYVEVMLGAQFIGHTYSPQFQLATIKSIESKNPIMKGIPSEWQRTDEWYSFDRLPRDYNTHILAVLDESSYKPEKNQIMGTHPIIWTRCIVKGRVFFSALGHKGETYSEPLHLKMISNALDWVLLERKKSCDKK